MMPPSTSAFRSLRNYNYRLWAAGALVSNIGTWMQRVAQDWLVLTELTHHDAAALGVVTGLQFGPVLLLLPLSGWAADRIDRRKLVMGTQSVLAVLALGLGLLTISGHVRLWEVFCFAGLLGCTTAFDTPARQTFISELVGDADLPNAVALNSTSFNGARMIGPAIAGIIIGAVGSGGAFLLNAASFAPLFAALCLMRRDELYRGIEGKGGKRNLFDGFRYVRQHRDIQTILFMLAVFGTFGLNFPIFISTMAVSVFHIGAGRFGLLTSMMAIGSVTGAFLSARRSHRDMRLLQGAALLFGGGCAAAAVMPTMWAFGGALFFVGLAAQTFNTSANSLVQLATTSAMRGRVMALFFAIAMGGTPIGAPIVGWIANHFGARYGMGVGAMAGFAAVAIGFFRSQSDGLAEKPGC